VANHMIIEFARSLNDADVIALNVQLSENTISAPRTRLGSSTTNTNTTPRLLVPLKTLS
jgi:hypothetical protein